jgi:hypothetical protein
MILTNEEALERIRKPYALKELEGLKKKTKELRAHVTGQDIKQYLPDLPQFERDELRDEREKMMLSNVDLLSRVLKPRNRIFSAKGGLEHFIIKDQNEERRFRDYINNITQGVSLKEWIQKFVMRRNDYDPNGIILIEQDAKKRIYPCFKSVLDIHDRELCGRTPEYLILKLCPKDIHKYVSNKIIHANYKETAEIYRVIDDTTDRLFTKNKLLVTVPSFSKPKFPGIVSSDIFGDEEGVFFSPIEDVFDILKQYLLRSSLYNVVFARQAFPKEWMQQFPCPNCQGTGVVEAQTCPECFGNKYMLSQKHSDTLVIDYRGDDMKNVPNPPMGNVQAAVDTLEFFDNNLEQREDKIHYGIWGMYKSDKIGSIGSVKRDTIGSNIEPTAYQAMLNSQPMVTQLVEFSKWYIGIYKFVCDMVGKCMFPNSYKGSAIMGGDRFMIESPDATWDRYLKAVKSLAPQSELDSILIEYIENKYCNNPLLYRKYMLLLSVEPFLHYPASEVLEWNIPEIQKMEKIYFDDWKTSMTDWEFTILADGLLENEELSDFEDHNDDSHEEDNNVDIKETNPIQNLKKSLREYTLDRINKDKDVLPPPIIETKI